MAAALGGNGILIKQGQSDVAVQYTITHWQRPPFQGTDGTLRHTTKTPDVLTGLAFTSQLGEAELQLEDGKRLKIFITHSDGAFRVMPE